MAGCGGTQLAAPLTTGHHTGYWNEDTANGTLEADSIDVPSLKMSSGLWLNN